MEQNTEQLQVKVSAFLVNLSLGNGYRNKALLNQVSVRQYSNRKLLAKK